VTIVLADPPCKGDSGFCAPGTDSFLFKPLVEWEWLNIHFQITKITILVWISVVLLIALLLAAVRNPKIVPERGQWMAESVYGLVRNNIAEDMIGHEGLRFAPYLSTLFCFILVTNVWGIIPVAQISPNAHIAYPAMLAIISWLMFNIVGIRKHGAKKYFGDILFMPGVPKVMYVLLTPIEFISTLIVRPITLAVRLFANMFAGHLLLLVFTLGTTYLLSVHNISKIFALPSFLMTILLTFFELFIEILQAYVFVVLTASYIQGALAEEH
jgi:F-type H+-transporting ATPase subunit a